MLDTGFISPGTMADDAGVGTKTWSNPDNAKVSDNTYATSQSGPIAEVISHYLKASNFGFSIPSGATINGIEIQIEKKVSQSNGAKDSTVKIIKADGSLGSENKAIVSNWPTTEAYSSYGGASDLWSESWTSENINDADFGVVLSTLFNLELNTASVDHVQIKVYYTEASSVISPFPSFRNL